MRRLFLLSILLLVPQSLHAQDAVKYSAPADVRASFKKLLDRPKVPLDVQFAVKQSVLDLAIEGLTFTSEMKNRKSERVPTVIIRPEKAKGRLPAVIVLHGTGGSAN